MHYQTFPSTLILRMFYHQQIPYFLPGIKLLFSIAGAHLVLLVLRQHKASASNTTILQSYF